MAHAHAASQPDAPPCCSVVVVASPFLPPAFGQLPAARGFLFRAASLATMAQARARGSGKRDVHNPLPPPAPPLASLHQALTSGAGTWRWWRHGWQGPLPSGPDMGLIQLRFAEVSHRHATGQLWPVW